MWINVKSSADFVKNCLKHKPESIDKVSTKVEDINIVADVTSVIDNLISAHESYSPQSDNKEKLKNYISKLSSFISMKDKIAQHSFSTKDSAIEKFCRLIAENEDLHKELDSLSVHSETDDSKELYSRLGKIINKFNISQLQRKVLFLQKLREKDDFDTLRKDYQDEWKFYSLLHDLTNDKEFKQTYIDKVIEEKDKPSNINLKEGISTYVKSMQQGKEAASKYFKEGAELQAYYTEVNSENRILNINLVDSNRSEPTKVSDILQQEKGTNELNIYFNKKREVYASQDKDKDKKRYYKFEKGAHYEMTSTWPVKDKDGNISSCIMIMHVSDSGITEILKFSDGTESQLSYEECMELIKQNHELHIQGFSLYDAVKKSLGLQCEEHVKKIEESKEQAPVSNVISQPNSASSNKTVNVAQSTNKDVPGTESKKSVNIPQNKSNSPRDSATDKTIIPAASANVVGQPNSPVPNVNFNSLIANKANLSPPGNAAKQLSTQPTIPLQKASAQVLPQPTVQVAATLKQAETQTEDLLRESSAQAEVYSQEASTQAKSNLQDTFTQTEEGTSAQTEVSLLDTSAQTAVNLQDTSAQTEVNLQDTSAQTEVNLQDTSAQTEVNLQDTSTQTEVKAQYIDDLRLEIKKLNKENVELKHSIEVESHELDNLKKRDQQLCRELEEVKIENTKLLTEGTNLANMLLERDQLNEKIKYVNEEFKNTIEKLEDEVCELEIERKKNKQELKNRDVAYQILMQVNSDRGREVAESKEENGKLMEENRQFKENLKNSNTENKRLKNEINTLQAELTQTRKDVEDIINSKGKVIEDLKREMSKLDKKHKEELMASQFGIGELAQELEEKGNELSLEKVKSGKLTNQIRDFKEEIKGLEEEYENRLKSDKKHIEKLEQKILELEYDVKEQDGDLQRRDQQIEEERELFRKVIESKKEKFQNAERIHRELEIKYEKVQQFEEEMKKFEQLIGPLKFIITGPNKCSIADAYMKLVEEKDGVIIEQENKIRELTEIIEDTAQEADRTVYELERSKEEIEYLNDKVDDLNNQVQDLADRDSKQRADKLSHLQNTAELYNLTGNTFIEAIANIREHISPRKPRNSVSDSDYASSSRSSSSDEESYFTPHSSNCSSPTSSPKNSRRFSHKRGDTKSLNNSFSHVERLDKSRSSSPLPDLVHR